MTNHKSRLQLADLPADLRQRIPKRLQENSLLDSGTVCLMGTVCLVWRGGTDKQGYGRFRIGGRHGPVIGAHRVAWECAHGPIPADRMVLHSCDNRRCIHPTHLRLGTHQENMDDMTERGRGHTKLTNHQVLEIWGFSMERKNKKELASEYGISGGSLDAILRGDRREAAFDSELEKEAEAGASIQPSPNGSAEVD
jgi:HNH endonuclease